MAERVSLDNVAPDQFELLVELLTEHVRERRVKIRFWMPSALELTFDSEWMSALLRSNELPVEACLAQLGADIPILLSAILMGRRSEIIWHIAEETELTEPDIEEDDSAEVIRAELLERCSVLEEKIVSEEIRHRYAIKATATNNILVGSEWEVVRRHSDSIRDSLEGLTYATLSLFVQKPIGRFSRIRPESETITVILTSEEILELKNNLQDALEAITQTEQTGEHP